MYAYVRSIYVLETIQATQGIYSGLWNRSYIVPDSSALPLGTSPSERLPPAAAAAPLAPATTAATLFLLLPRRFFFFFFDLFSSDPEAASSSFLVDARCEVDRQGRSHFRLLLYNNSICSGAEACLKRKGALDENVKVQQAENARNWHPHSIILPSHGARNNSKKTRVCQNVGSIYYC